jgi:integrase
MRFICLVLLALLSGGSLSLSQDRGASGPEEATWKDIQEALVWHGYYAGPLDGELGEGTVSAIVKFQQARGGIATGHLSQAELIELLRRKARVIQRTNFRVELDSDTGIVAGIPRALLTGPFSKSSGSDYLAADGTAQISLRIRIGETRGLGWRRVLHDALQVRDAADRFNELGPVKTVAALRDVPIGPQLARILADWKLASNAQHELAFPSEGGTPLNYSNVANRQIGPLQVALGIVALDGSPRWTPHLFRHFAVSLWIDEGAELKQVSEWAGHESPEFTQRVYGHLFKKRRTDRTAATAGEVSVLGQASTQHEYNVAGTLAAKA